MSEILRGDVWLFNPDPVKGREIGKKLRPAIIISNDLFNNSGAELVIVIPLTTKAKGIPSHIRLLPSDGGVKEMSFAMCEQVRSVSKTRLITKWGCVRNKHVLLEIAEWLADLMEIT